MTQQTDHVPDKKLTAVDWLKDKIEMNTMCDLINGVEYWDKKTLLEFIQQAKAMEKEQIIKAIEDWYTFDFESAEQYYNELYNK